MNTLQYIVRNEKQTTHIFTKVFYFVIQVPEKYILSKLISLDDTTIYYTSILKGLEFLHD